MKPDINDQWMGMTDDEAESSKSEDGVVEDESVTVDGPADMNSLRMDPVQADLRARIANQRASLKKRVENLEERRQKLQRCVQFGVSIPISCG